MVYAAWMRQAAEGRILFDNRFTTDPQPGQTFHAYFLALGWVSAIIGPVAAANLARVGFSCLFVALAARFVRRLQLDTFTSKLALTLLVLAGGVGFLVWHTFGRTIVRPESAWASSILHGGLPTDVWQPEGFVFPSMLTNGLFGVSLCLILLTLTTVLDCRTGWRPLLLGVPAFGVLANIHSYDALLVGLVLGTFAVTMAAQRQLSGKWIARTLVLVLAGLPAALWFWHVYTSDPVFRERAATETYSPTFRQLVAGYLPALVAGVVALWMAAGRSVVGRAATMICACLVLIGFGLSASRADQFWLSWPEWACVWVAATVLCALLATGRPAHDLVISWALMGLVAGYVPVLFQRKLLMGLIIPWAILAALGIAAVVRNAERSRRNLSTALGILVLSASSVLWLQRELQLLRLNVSSTTVQPVILSPSAARIVHALASIPGRKTVAAIPGLPNPTGRPDSFDTPLIPDLNPVLSGFAGAYTYAGHWSETPDYLRRRSRSIVELFSREATPEQRSAFLRETGIEYVVAPDPAAFSDLGLADLRGLGEVLVKTPQWLLIRVAR